MGKSVWTFDQAGERRALRQRHIARRLAKVPARGCFGSVHAAAEINPVQIQLEDFLFAEIVFDALGQKNLQQLPAVCSFFERETVARQLLCDGAAALADMAGRQIFERCANDPEQIVAVVLVKFCVLDCNHGVDQIAEPASRKALSRGSRRRFGQRSSRCDRESHWPIPFARACSSRKSWPALVDRRRRWKRKLL